MTLASTRRAAAGATLGAARALPAAAQPIPRLRRPLEIDREARGG